MSILSQAVGVTLPAAPAIANLSSQMDPKERRAISLPVTGFNFGSNCRHCLRRFWARGATAATVTSRSHCAEITESNLLV